MTRYVKARLKQEQSKLKVPDDFQEGLAGYTYGLLCLPDSTLWKSYVRGAISGLGKARAYNKETGNILEARDIGQEIERSLCFMSCDDLLTSLSLIQAAIEGVSLSGVETKLDSIVNRLAYLEEIQEAIDDLTLTSTVNVDLAGVESRMDSMVLGLTGIDTTIGTIPAPVQNIADRVDDLGTDLGYIRDEISDKLLNLAEMIRLENTKLVKAVVDKNLSVTINIPLGVEPSPELVYPPEWSPPVDCDACYGALTYWHLQAEFLGELISSIEGVINWPTGAIDYFLGIFRELSLGYLTRDKPGSLQTALDWWIGFYSEGIETDWSALQAQFLASKNDLVCAYKSAIEQGDEEIIFDAYATYLPVDLASILIFSDVITIALYASNDYFGDNSAFWQNWQRMRLYVEDTYSCDMCNDC